MSPTTCRAMAALLATLLIWGFFPVYLSFMRHLPVDSVMLQRILWSAILGWLLVASRRDWHILTLRQIACLTLTGFALGGFWFIFIWGVPNHHVLDLSLGNFLAPLLMTAGGVLLFKEKLDRLELTAIACAVIGLLILVFGGDHFPWVAGVVAISFSAYSVMRKHIAVKPSLAFAVEASALLAAAAVYTGFHSEVIHTEQPFDLALMIGTAVLTVVPMTLYGIALRGLKMATVGMVGYLAPSIAFLTGIFYFHEPISPMRLAAFICVWIGLAIYSYNARRKNRAALRPIEPSAELPR